MIRSINCILIILILLISTLFAFVAIFIIATELPESFLDKYFANAPRNESVSILFPPTRKPIKTTTIPSTTKMPSSSTKTSTKETTTTIMSTTTSVKDLPIQEIDNEEMENSTIHKLTSFPTQLKMSNDEKIMSIGLKEDTVFYAAKANGEIEFFNWTSFESLKMEHVDVPIHRMGFLSDGRLVVTETQTKTLHLFDQNYKVVVELKLSYQALDLKIFNDLIYVLSRLDGSIFVYDKNLVQKFKISWNKQNSCNFIQPIDDFVFVSCDNSVLKLSNNGDLVGRATIPGALYSLAIYYSNERKELWAVQRGREEIDVYDEKLEFKYKMSTENEENAVWSTIGFDDERLFALDYVSNTIQFFTI